MYDFEAEREGQAGPSPVGAPARALLYLELPRWIGEYAASRTLDLVTPARDVGGGRPVLVLPGFSANDAMTGRLRGHLRRHGFRVHGWKLGRNHGLTDRLVDGVEDRFTAVAAQYDEPVSIVGWSFGGLLARWLAHEHADGVRQIVCLGSPWRAEGERTRATAMFERSRERHGISERAREIVETARGPVPVPTTAIWSRTDGIVPWKGCRVDDATDPAPAENVEVLSSHVGMVANPLVLATVVDRLAQDPAHWRPFSWKGLIPGVAS
ncbi:esterase/lipase family protein [Nocardioides panacisoli]|uniref:Alpha/beta hydrolase n=1 Tax=Nocardioides panacisoli TaxID=627624 RepID=A0ABP7IZE4_9ACTN